MVVVKVFRVFHGLLFGLSFLFFLTEAFLFSLSGLFLCNTFSHKKSIVNKATWLDVPFRYAPYASWKHKFVRMFVH